MLSLVIVVRGTDTLVVVPARGGSKGVPRKNLLPVAGKPLLAWTVAAASDAVARLRVVVSTEDEEIAALATSLGAEVVERPASLASDLSATEPALLHALDALSPTDDVTRVMMLQATSPVRLPGTIDRALAEHTSSGCTSLVGVVEMSPFVWRGPTDSPTAQYDVGHRRRRQDLRPSDLVYRETGSLYVTTISALRATSNRISGPTALFVMAAREGLDIDTADDVEEAERMLGGGGRAARA
jgi:N-acylneuraminate cytidylyltransferase